MSEKNNRIHLVETPSGKRLIRAATKNGAIRHAAKDIIKCSVATQDELVAAVGAGIKVEDAGAEEQEA